MVTVTEDEEERGKWVKHYYSLHQILLVGEGDFSFSLSLALSFGSASNIVATSLDAYDTVIKKYNKAKSNLQNLENLGASLLHGVDATKMKLHTDLKMRKFDMIIFNFPHAGFHGKEDSSHLIRKHKNLVRGFFKNANRMLRHDGEIHVNHKITAPFCDWNLEGLASQSSLALIECVDFRIQDYPGYNNKRGDGSRCDEPFPLGECCTFKFRFSPNTKKNPKLKNIPNFARPRADQLQEIPIQMLQQPITFSSNRSRTEYTANTNYSPRYVGPPLAQRRTPQLQEIPSGRLQQQPIQCRIEFTYSPWDVGSSSTYSIRSECERIFGGYLNRVEETFGRPDFDPCVHEVLRLGFERYMSEIPERTINDYIHLLEELHRLSILRSAWLRRKLLGLDH